jgi:hypothetical protein
LATGLERLKKIGNMGAERGRAASSEKPSSSLDLNRVKNSQIGGCNLRYVAEVDGVWTNA